MDIILIDLLTLAARLIINGGWCLKKIWELLSNEWIKFLHVLLWKVISNAKY